jgi:radical SAM superfamily enzyme YgiQ (UPF0313 family)
MRVLLSSPVLPYPSFKDGRDNLHHNYANTTYGQDIFSIPTVTNFYGLHLIAQNISAATTVLENPSTKDFAREVQKSYDLVGIYFVIPFFSKVLEMCRIVRDYSPHSRIVLGGPGVQCFSHTTGKEEDLLSLVDYVCKGEGIRFVRTVLGEPIDKPIVQDLPLGAVVPFNYKGFAQYSPSIISALGCTNCCEFCAASAFFGHRRIPMATPFEIFQIIKHYMAKYNIRSARILDDNFLVDKHFVQQLGVLLRKDSECQERGFTYSTFANLSAINQYDYEELVEHGISGLLIGVESKFVDKLTPNVRKKLEGIDTKEVVRNLADLGIFVEGSMILGWDFHDRASIMEDIEFYASLGATFDQIVCLIPVPETSLWNQLKGEGRLFDNISWDEAGFYTKWHKYKNFDHEELWKYEDLALKKCFETWGPSYLRLFDVHLRGYKRFKTHTDPYLRKVAEVHKEGCKQLYPVLLACRLHSPSEAITKRVNASKEAFKEEFGMPSVRDELKSLAVTGLATYRKIQNKLIREDTRQPRFEVYQYN